MKLKVYVVDLEISPRIKRWMLRLSVPAVLLLGTVAYAALPKTWTQGETLTAANLNANFKNLDDRLVSAERMRIFFKDGNNGTVSCNTYCANQAYGKEPEQRLSGTCVGAQFPGTTEYTSCEAGNPPPAQGLLCYCSRILWP